MKKAIVVISSLCLIMVFSCNKEDDKLNFKTGIVGHIEFGSGDCMPIIDYSARTFSPYNGVLYFIIKSDLENLNGGDFNELQANSIKQTIVNGALSVALPVDTFLVMPSEFYLYSEYNTIIIEEGIVLEKDFAFYECTSY